VSTGAQMLRAVSTEQVMKL